MIHQLRDGIDLTLGGVAVEDTICRHYGVECLDLHDIDKQRGHPSQKGMKAIAKQVLKRLK